MRIPPWLAPAVAMAVVSVAVSYGWPLFALLQERAGYSGFLIGLNATFAALAIVGAAPFMPALLARLGLIRLMLISVGCIALCFALIPVAYDFWWWSLIRINLGIWVTAMFFAAEYWLVAIAPEGGRGRIVAIYSVILSGSYALGPYMLNLAGLDSFWTFGAPVAFVLCGAVPILLGRATAPPADSERPATVRETLGYFVSDPTIMWGVVLFGTIEFGAMGLASVWGVRSGMAEGAALFLLTAMALGSLAFQFPTGWAADRFDRRRMLLAAGAGACVAPVVMLYGGAYGLILAGSVLWGGTAVALYTLALTELGGRYTGAKLAAGNAAVVLAYGVGALLGPAGFGKAMDVIPPDGVLWLAALAALIYAGLVAIRIRMNTSA